MTAAVPAGLPSLAPLDEKFEGIHRIAVLRGGGLGDLLFALPAIRSLAAAYPDAQVMLLGSHQHAQLLAGQPGAPHAVEELPIRDGIREEPGRREDPLATQRFLDRMRRPRFDLAVQVHGGGRFSNPFLLELGAVHTVGCATPDAVPLERSLRYTYYQHEMLRALEVVGLAGAAPVSLEPSLTAPAGPPAGLLDPGARGVVLIHPGATDPRRRWPAERFAWVAGAVAADGAQVIVVGDAADAGAAREIVDRVDSAGSPAAAARVSSVAGRLTLPQFVSLAARADVFLGNDSGPRHVAAAVGKPTVSVYWFGNLINAGPLSRGRHRIHLSWTTQCPVCGRDCTQVGWTAPRCEHDVSFVSDVAAEPVLADVLQLLHG